MAIHLKPGVRLFSAACETEMIAVRAPVDPVDLTIGGIAPLLDAGGRSGEGAVVDGHGGGAAMGKRYVDDAGTLELLCTRPGDGVPAVAGSVLTTRDAKALPASD